MQSDDLDNKIRGLADTNEPAYDEASWNRMEALLDKHLPQEKKRRRAIFWILLLAGLGISGYLSWQYGTNRSTNTNAPVATGNQTKTGSAANTTAPADDHSSNADITPANANSVAKTNAATGKPGGEKKIIPGKEPFERSGASRPIVNNNLSNAGTPTGNAGPLTAYHSSSNDNKKQDGQKQTSPITTPAASTDENADPIPASPEKNALPTIKDEQGNAEPAIPINKDIAQTTKKDTPGKTDSTTTASKTKKPAAKESGFFLTVAAGPDISSIGVDRPGKMDLQYGLGIGYAFNNRWAVRTGFYTTQKRYEAAPSEYHPPFGYWTYSANLQKIDANCKVYEVPLNVMYSFNEKKDHQWFLSGGVSSYIMKREVYNYDVKNSSGQSVYYSRTIDNKNKHLFSVLALSGGYIYTINKHLSLQAEPYLKVPLTGVGFGKVNLNSGGSLITVKIKPFGR